jgi:alpha-L-arabinofuranosidase
VVKTPLFHVFKQYGEWMRGDALAVTVQAPMTVPPTPRAHYPKYRFPADFNPPESPCLDAAAALRDRNSLVIALVNRHGNAVADVELNLPAGFAPQSVWTLHHEDVFAANTFDAPERVAPATQRIHEPRWSCPPHSVSLILCKRAGAILR